MARRWQRGPRSAARGDVRWSGVPSPLPLASVPTLSEQTPVAPPLMGEGFLRGLGVTHRHRSQVPDDGDSPTECPHALSLPVFGSVPSRLLTSDLRPLTSGSHCSVLPDGLSARFLLGRADNHVRTWRFSLQAAGPQGVAHGPRERCSQGGRSLLSRN